MEEAVTTRFMEHVSFLDIHGNTQLGNPVKDCYFLQRVGWRFGLILRASMTSEGRRMQGTWVTALILKLPESLLSLPEMPNF